jgi:hypothetical protein
MQASVTLRLMTWSLTVSVFFQPAGAGVGRNLSRFSRRNLVARETPHPTLSSRTSGQRAFLRLPEQPRGERGRSSASPKRNSGYDIRLR